MAIKIKSRISVRHDTTAKWNNARGFVPLSGEIIVYTDFDTDDNGNDIPNIKIGNGNAYVQELPFLGVSDSKKLLDHISNTSIHVSSADRLLWSNKLNVDDDMEIEGETLVFNRN